MRGEPLRGHAPTLLALLDDAARRAPNRPFLVERDARGAWHQASFATVAERSRQVGAGLRALGASERRPVMILGRNGIEHALVAFGAMRAGIPAVSVPAAAAPGAPDGLARLRAIAESVRPAVVFARDGATYAAAAGAVAPDAAYVAVAEPPGGGAHDFARLLAHGPLADDAASPGTETPAKVMFAVGASGDPRGVVTTHGMVCSLLQAVTQAWPFLEGEPPVVVNRLPWSHWLGGNVVLGIVLRHAGTLYIDDDRGRLRDEISPTLAFDVPHGWTAWAERLRADDALRRRWLSRLDLASWSGATLAPATRDALRAMRVPLAASWGATETAGSVTLTTGVDPKYDALGIPLAGSELKLVPTGDAYEARVRGLQVTPGYWWRPDRTAAAFDEEGYYRTGDVVRPIDVRAPQRGLAFVSRLDERFKLSSGAWVRAGALHESMLAECSDLADVAVVGEGRDEVGLFVWPTAEALGLDRDALRAQIAAAMHRAATSKGAADRPRRALIVEQPRRELDDRMIARLYASEPDADVILA